MLWVEEGPRGALGASQEHSGLLAVHTKRNIAAVQKKRNYKRCFSLSFFLTAKMGAQDAASFRGSQGPLPNAGALQDVYDVELVLLAGALLLR